MSEEADKQTITTTVTDTGDVAGSSGDLKKAPKWFIARVSPNSEKSSRDHLLQLGYEAFVASQEEIKFYKNGPRKKRKKVERVVITQYVFLHITEMEQKFPEAFKQFKEVCAKLEDHYKDMQDMEFTVEHGKLYMLQTRNGKRTAQAALKIACDLVDAGMRTEEEAVAMIDPRNLDALLHPTFDQSALVRARLIGKALGAAPGAASGKIVFTAADAEDWAARGEKVVLVRLETSPEDITGMKVAQGILTVRGGMTSHAAVVARGMGACCVSGCGDIIMDEENKKFTLAGKEYHEGDVISFDGTTGNIYDGAVPTVDAKIAGEFGRVMAWADKLPRMTSRMVSYMPTLSYR